MQKARAVRAGVLAEKEHRIALLEVFEHAGADRRADQLVEGHRRRLVAHVRAVGQIVVAVQPREQRVEIRGLQRGPAGGVKHRLLGIARLQRRADRRERVLPGAGHIAVARGVVTQRMGEAALLFEVVVGPAPQLAHGMAGEEVGRAAMGGQFPQGRLRAVLAEFEGVRMFRLAPGTARTHEAAGLVLLAQRVERAHGRHLAADRLHDAPQRPPAAGAAVVIGVFRLIRHRPYPALQSVCKARATQRLRGIPACYLLAGDMRSRRERRIARSFAWSLSPAAADTAASAEASASSTSGSVPA